MKIRDIISRLAELRHNLPELRRIVEDINRLEKYLIEECMNGYVEISYNKRDYPKCMDEEIILEDRFADIYLSFLACEIDFYNQDMSTRAAMEEVYKQRIYEYMKYLSGKREFKPINSIKI